MSNDRRVFLNWCAEIGRSLVAPACLLCGAPGARAWCCEGCEAELPRLPAPRCAVCALPLAQEGVCGECLARPPRYDRVIAPFAYRFPVDALVHAFKYRGRLGYARPLGTALAAVAPREVDAIVAMPLAPGRLRERGFNQAQELARVVAARTGLPLLREACRRVLETAPQAGLPREERARNVRRAFACEAALEGRRIAVVDDVLTTGATLNELARVLKKAGAAAVEGWVLARALPR
jgi:ComF family protein